MVGEEFKDSFIVGSINCNCFRKKWDVLIHSFCIFAQKVENSILVIKTNINNDAKDTVYGGYNIIDLIKKYCGFYSIKPNRIRIIDSFLSRRDLNNLYNIFDVFLSTTSGEGWGLTTIEAAITKTPLVIPKCTSFPEIFGDNYKGYFKTHDYPIYIGRSHCEIDLNLNIVPGLFNCICMGYKNYESCEVEYKKSLIEIKEDIPTLVINKTKDIEPFKVLNKLNIIEQFETYENCISFIRQANLNIYQVVISVDFNLLKEILDFMNSSKFFKEKHLYKITHVNKEIIRRSFCNITNPTCKIANLIDVANKLIELTDHKKREKLGEEVFNKVKGVYIEENIKNRFNEIFEKWFKKI